MSYQFWELITCPYKISAGFTELNLLALTQHNYYINVLIPSANSLLGTWLKFSRKTPKRSLLIIDLHAKEVCL